MMAPIDDWRLIYSDMNMKKQLGILVVILALLAGMISSLPARVPETLHGAAPAITGKTWLNSKPLELSALQGKVVMVEFWTYGCYNCKNVEPYLKQWYSRYHGKGFEIVAVHSPEFEHERDISNVKNYVKRNGINYPVAIDNDFAIWKRYNNHYWPVMYLIDKQGQLRYRHIGEGAYGQTEQMIQKLLAETTRS